MKKKMIFAMKGIILAVLLFVSIFPIYWLFLMALRPPTEISSGAGLIPGQPTLEQMCIRDRENITKEIRTKAEHSLYELPTTVGQQEGGFASCVPLGVNRVQTDCMLPTKEAVLFSPLPDYIQKNVK